MTTIPMNYKVVLGCLFGVIASAVMALVGPLWGGLVVILGFPLVFRREDRISLAALFWAFSLAWALFVLVGAPAALSREQLPAIFLAGFVPVALIVATVLIARRTREGSSDMAGR